MNRGILFGVGVGPGDPELLTIKAARILEQADIIAVPDKGTGQKTAFSIVKDYVQGKPVMECVTPMVRDQAVLDAAHEEITQRLCQQLDQGKNIAFITLGDPSVYSTYYYIHCRVQKRGYEAQLVPGVPSFCAVAARLNTSLCERSQRLMIVPASHKDISDCLDVDANLVFMKAGKEIGALQRTLRDKGLIDQASLVANCGMEGEQVWEHFGDMPEDTGYFSVVVVKRGDSGEHQDGRD